MKKVYIIRKYVVAESVEDALKQERKAKVVECYVDEGSQKKMIDSLHEIIKEKKDGIGFVKK